MNTIYDWATVCLFAGLIVLFLQRSVAPEPPGDALWQYLVAAVGCAGVNWLGNEGHHAAAIAVAVVLLAYIYKVLRPFDGLGTGK